MDFVFHCYSNWILFHLSWAEEREKKNHIDLFFPSLTFQDLKNVFDYNDNIFLLVEMSHEQQTYLGTPSSSKDLPVSNICFLWVMELKKEGKESHRGDGSTLGRSRQEDPLSVILHKAL